ncbi:Forkhead-associated (FHA) domain [Macleaya cordata]|uniref:Forkhead-associated (FHA) domain n=1 Tax=Macleaya cordata TaxID=56857 RepID=A0A200QTD2_MACCD|nr:Forkhead-associated (FHA) domain [Macleaya cordata]
MGALAPITPWIAEDDLLLKNAVEAGASLESLAKGAVRFSRRFTIQELQERWHSLLYDPVISEQASSRMVELQKSAPNLSSKSNRFGVFKGNEWVPGKRKEESVRSHYYAMRKRICTEPCSSIDLSFLVAPSLHKCIGNGGGCQGQLALLNEHQDGNCMIGDPIADDFELQDTDYDIVRHAFPQIASAETAAGNICGTAHAFHYGHMGSFEGDLPDDCLYGFAENVSSFAVNEAVGNDMGHSFEQANVHKDIPHILGERVSVFDNSPGVQEIGPPQELPVSDFDSIANNQETVCSGFGGRQDFSSPVLDCGASFHQLGFSSPLPAMSDITTPAMPIDENLADKDKSTGDALTLPPDGDAKKVSPSGYDVFLSGTQLRERECSDGLASSTAISEGDFVDLSHSPLNFTHEEVLLFMNDDGKDMMDRSCLDGLNSVLLSSPNDTHRNDISGISNPEASAALDTGLAVTDVACPVELEIVDDPLHSGQKGCDSEIIVPSSTEAPYPDFPERCNGIICCTLNTEDPEIPNNDDLFSPSQVLPSFVSAAMQRNSEGSSVPTSTKDFVDNQKASEQGLNLVNEEGETARTVASRKIETQVLPEICPNRSINDSGVKSELLESDPRRAGTAGGDPSQCRSAPATQHSIPAGELNKEFTQVELGKHSDFDNSLDCVMERPNHVSNHMKNQPEINVDGCKQEADVPATIQIHAEPSAIEMDFPEPMLNPSISDQEEQLSENNDDLPYFSDVEAMILDMDLGPCDQDSCLGKEVSRYRYEDTKRAIIRLEQGANSYMQRAIGSHRAFAIFYGRHLKHYIKKPEVLLGRATDDVIVDIDLGREGRANKISRRQAIIKMEDDGSFYFKNLGKCPVLVNSKELSGGRHLKLSSGCLIEVCDFVLQHLYCRFSSLLGPPQMLFQLSVCWIQFSHP